MLFGDQIAHSETEESLVAAALFAQNSLWLAVKDPEVSDQDLLVGYEETILALLETKQPFFPDGKRTSPVYRVFKEMAQDHYWMETQGTVGRNVVKKRHENRLTNRDAG